MATLTSGYSLVEQAKRLEPDGKLAVIAEALNYDTGDILKEAPWLPSNDIWVNKTVRRATLPLGSRRKLNGGVPTEVSRTTEVIDNIEMLATYAEYDKDWIDSFPNPQEARLMEARAFIQGLGQTLVSSFLYSNANLNPDRMHGLAPRLNVVNDLAISNGGSGNDLTSVYVVTWGRDTAYFVYPKNIPQLGITHTDAGEVTLSDASTLPMSNSQYQGYRDFFQVRCGFVVRHPRAIGRVANIESAGAVNTFNENNLITLLNNMVTSEFTRIYVNQTVKTQAEIRLKDKSNVYWSVGELGGAPLLRFRGIPVKLINKSILLNTESAIS